jgi:hypothetical protein
MGLFVGNTAISKIFLGNTEVTQIYRGNIPLISGGGELYDFTTFTFTNAGITGTSGPTLTQCKSSYNTTTYSWLNNTSFFNMISQGIQIWTVPSDGSYIIDAYGAKGGASGYGVGGNGARILGTFLLTQGQKLRILVGQMGGNGSGLVGGGGGGMFVMKETGSTTSDILVIAGGGGGGQYSSYRSSETQIGGQAGTTSGAGWYGAGGSSLNNGRTNSAGGLVYNNSGGGGGGLTGNGQTSLYGIGGNNGTGGYSFINSGNAYPSTTYTGGFGGGGSGDWVYYTGGGGGGGYAGGSGGYYYGNGGGGASYNNGTIQTNTGNSNTTHGKVIITKI